MELCGMERKASMELCGMEMKTRMELETGMEKKVGMERETKMGKGTGMEKKMRKVWWISILCIAFVILAGAPQKVFAAAEEAETIEESAQESATGTKAMAAGIAIGLTAAAGAIGMAIAIAKSSDGIARQPEAAGDIRSSLTLGLVFIETAIIYALIVAILIIFVL